MEKILLAGYFGFNNIGDDAILLSEIDFLKKEGFVPIILTNKGSRVFNEISINRYNFFKILKIINQFKYFILGGGGIFQDKTSFRSLIYYIFLIYFMKFLNKKVILLNVGIGPIKRKISEKILHRGLKKCDLILFRDEYSLKYFKDLKRSYLSSDSSFYLNFSPKERKNKILVSIRFFDGFDPMKFKKLFEKIDEEIKFIVFSKEEIKIAETLNLEYIYHKNPVDVIEDISTSKFLIGMRYHSIIFSILTSTPFVGIVYDIKVKNLIDELNLKNYILPESNVENWINTFEEYYNKREDLEKFLNEKRELFIIRVKNGYDILRRFLKNESI